jgi:hypothetical protein
MSCEPHASNSGHAAAEELIGSYTLCRGFCVRIRKVRRRLNLVLAAHEVDSARCMRAPTVVSLSRMGAQYEMISYPHRRTPLSP